MTTPNANNATAADFSAAAQQHANAFWFWLVTATVVWYLFKAWAVIPAVFALWTMINSFGATVMANRLRAGTYTMPNPNNGAPDGDARNYGNWPSLDPAASGLDPIDPRHLAGAIEELHNRNVHGRPKKSDDLD